MNRFSKIYVLAPHQLTTGGIELSHQLVDFLNKSGANASIVYVNVHGIVKGAQITPAYDKYEIFVADSIEDNIQNILILPEIYFDWIFEFSKIQIGCWWMSVDNYYKSCSLLQGVLNQRGLYDKIRLIYHKRFDFKSNINTISDLKHLGDRITNFYQSHYAQYHLYSLGFSKVLPLSDYINTELISGKVSVENKENIILYYPVKGGKYVESIKNDLLDYQFIPLIGLSRLQLVELFAKAKLYIDFGHHPGKDRIPREAVVNKCCVITSRTGSAAFYEDVPIPSSYKFDINKVSRKKIISQINWVLNNYDSCIDDFAFYREKVMKEKEVFYNEIVEFFKMPNIKN